MSDDANFTTENGVSTLGRSLYERQKPSTSGIFLNAVILVFCAVLCMELLFNVFYTGIYVANISMQPTLNGAPVLGETVNGEDVLGSGGDFIYVNTFVKPDYGDIVVVYRETKVDGKVKRGNIIKRVVAFGGDTVEIVAGVLFVNGKKVDESYLSVKNNDPNANNFPLHTVKEGCMFLLGDNRNKSTDSRDNGDYPLSGLVGVVPEWSLKVKGFTSSIYNFFNFTLRGQ